MLFICILHPSPLVRCIAMCSQPFLIRSDYQALCCNARNSKHWIGVIRLPVSLWCCLPAVFLLLHLSVSLVEHQNLRSDLAALFVRQAVNLGHKIKSVVFVLLSYFSVIFLIILLAIQVKTGKNTLTTNCNFCVLNSQPVRIMILFL